MSAKRESAGEAGAGLVSKARESLVIRLVELAASTAREVLPPALAWLRGIAVNDVASAKPDALRLPHDFAERFQQMAAAWRAHPVAGEAVAFALDVAVAAVTAVRRQESTELIWTGPDPDGARWRRMEQALLEVCAAAKSRLILTTYSASPRPDLLAALRAAVARGVTVWIVLETKSESGGGLKNGGVASFYAGLGKSVALYVWPAEKRAPDGGQPGLLHAKVAVADESMALVSSANLSGAALERNIEAGILVRGGAIPGTLRGHIEGLVRDKVLVALRG